MMLAQLPFPIPTSNQAVFLILAAVACAGALGVVVMNNAVRSAMCLVVTFFVLAFIYFGLSAQLLGITQILVYTGAIMVLFLFVIMLLNLGGEDGKEKGGMDLKILIAAPVGLGLFALIATQILLPLKGVTEIKAANDFGSPQAIGKVLFTNYVWPFEVTSILLLVGIVGSILLAKRKI